MLICRFHYKYLKLLTWVTLEIKAVRKCMYEQGPNVWWVLMNCKEHQLRVGSNCFFILNVEVGYHTVEWVSFFLSSPWCFFFVLWFHKDWIVTMKEGKCIQKQFNFVWCQMPLCKIKFCKFLLKIITKELWPDKCGQLHKVLCQECHSAVPSDKHGLLDMLMWPVWKIPIFSEINL